MPTVSFADITADAGNRIRPRQRCAWRASSSRRAWAGGAAFLDYDNDGDPDLLFVNSKEWDDSGDPGDRQTLPQRR